MKCFIKIMTLFMIAITLSGCSFFQGAPYLSITLTDKDLKTHFFKYDITSKIISEVAGIPLTAQYPLGVIDLKNQALYYSERDSSGCDQLVKLDLRNNQKEKLTNNLFAINHIIPVGNKIILTALKKADMEKGYRYLGLFSYDLKSKTLTSWWEENDHDTSVRTLTFNPYTKRLYASLYSWKEQLQKSHKAEQEQAPDVVPAVHRIVEYDINGRLLREIYRAEEYIAYFAVSKDGKLALLSSAPMVFHERNLFLVNLETRKKEPLKIDNFKPLDYLFAPDLKGIYFTAGSVNALYYYDFAIKQVEKIFSQPNGYINNFLLMLQS